MDDYGPLRFDFADFLQEISAIENLATNRFLDATAPAVFNRLKEQLRHFQLDNGRSQWDWKVDQELPLRTLDTLEYEKAGRKGARRVFGEISWCWQLKNCPSKKGHVTAFEVFGNASIRLRICESEGDRNEIARWRVECGAADSPGCFFHTQVFGDDTDRHFPKNVPVPRLPTLFVTPMSVIEFFLGELFQDAWERQLVGDDHHKAFWKRNQKLRLTQLLKWKLQQVESCDNGSPWLALKRAKPRQKDTLFVEKK